MSPILTIWKKELRDTIRDKRTIFSMILMPLILMPLLFIGIAKLTEFQIKKSIEDPITLGIINGEKLPELMEEFKKYPHVTIKNIDAIETAQTEVRDEKIDAGIVIPENIAETLKNEEKTALKIIKKLTNTHSSGAIGLTESIVEEVNKKIIAQRLQKQKLAIAILTGIELDTEELATQKEQGGFGLGFLLPLFIVMWSIIGGQYTAIDVSAGEKERKTLEALFLTPVKRLHIVLGKFLAVGTAALTSVTISLVSMYIASTFFISALFKNTGTTAPSSLPNFNFSLDLPALGILFIISLLLVSMFSAILLSIAIFAKSYKEAQSYLAPLMIVFIIPISVFNTPFFTPSDVFYIIPGLNAIFLFKEILIGVYNSLHITLVFGSLLIFSIATLLLATKIYKKENVLFKE